MAVFILEKVGPGGFSTSQSETEMEEKQEGGETQKRFVCQSSKSQGFSLKMTTLELKGQNVSIWESIDVISQPGS